MNKTNEPVNLLKDKAEEVETYWTTFTELFRENWLVAILALGLLLMCVPGFGQNVHLVLARTFSIFKGSRRFYTKNKFERDITKSTKSINKSIGFQLIPEKAKINWAKDESRDAFIQDDKVVIKMAYNDDRSKTVALAVYSLVEEGLLVDARKYIPTELFETSALLTAHNVLRKNDVAALNAFYKTILHPTLESDENLKNKFNELLTIDNKSMFLQILVPELMEMAILLENRIVNQDILTEEIEQLVNFLLRYANRSAGEQTNSDLRSRFFNLGIVIAGKREKLEEKGIVPYLYYIRNKMKFGAKHIYVMAVGYKMRHAAAIGRRFSIEEGVELISHREGEFITDNGNSIPCLCVLIKYNWAEARKVDTDQVAVSK